MAKHTKRTMIWWLTEFNYIAGPLALVVSAFAITGGNFTSGHILSPIVIWLSAYTTGRYLKSGSRPSNTAATIVTAIAALVTTAQLFGNYYIASRSPGVSALFAYVLPIIPVICAWIILLSLIRQKGTVTGAVED